VEVRRAAASRTRGGPYLRSHFQLDDLDFVCYDGRFVSLVEGGVEHLDGIVVKLV